MSGPTYRSSTSAENGSNQNPTSSLVLSVPAGVQNGDLLIASIDFDTGTSITPPAGWTLIGSRIDSGTTISKCTYKRIASSEPASYTWNFGALVGNAGIMQCWYNLDPTSPINANGGQANAASNTVTAPSITTTVDGCQILFLGTTHAAWSAFGKSWTAPTGYTQRAKATGAGGDDPNSEASDNAQVAHGATGSVAATNNAAAAVNIGQLLALAPLSADLPPGSPSGC